MNRKIWYAPNKFESYGTDEINAVKECLEAGWLAGDGAKTKEFQEKIAEYCGKKYGLFVNSGSSANLLALCSVKTFFNLNNDAEVITPACTFSTAVAPIIQVGLTPIFCDVDLNTYIANFNELVSLITLKTKIIMIPNLIGNKFDFKKLREYLKTIKRPDIYIIEDSCDMLTDTSYSDISTTSFYASHIITCGSGGMMMCNNKKILDIANMYSSWGRIGDNSEEIDDRFNHNIEGIPYDYKFLYGVVGYNFKSSEMNAAFGLVQFEKLEKFKLHRRSLIERYLENLKDNKYIILPDNSQKTDWLAMPLLCNEIDRKNLLTFIEKNNIQTRVCFAGNITKHPAYSFYKKDFKNADYIMANGFLLGAHQGMNLEDVDYVCSVIKNFCDIYDAQKEIIRITQESLNDNLVGVLLMIKNEEDVIKLTIDSTKKHIKHVIVYDTGSDDETIEILKKTCKKNGQILHLKIGEFINFPESRNISLEFAETIDVKYLILMDAAEEFRTNKTKDEFLENIKKFPENMNFGLVKHKWIEYNRDTEHFDMRFVRNKIGSRYDTDIPVHVNFLNSQNHTNLDDLFILFQDRMKNAESTSFRLEKDIKEFLKAKKTKRNYYYLSQTYANLNDFKNAYKYGILSLETPEDPNKPSYVDERATHARLAYYAIQLRMDFSIIRKYCDVVINSPNPNIEAFIYLFRASIIYKCPNNVIKYVEQLMNLRKPNDGQIVNHNFYDYQRWTCISIVCLMSNQKLRIGKQACDKAIRAFPTPEHDDVQNMNIYNKMKI